MSLRGKAEVRYPVSQGARTSSVLLINQYFWPDMAATAQLLADLAEDLAESGHDVSVIAGKSAYALEDGRFLPNKETWRGVSIRRVWCTNRGRGTRAGRILDYASFLSSAAVVVLFGRRYRVVVCLSTPPLIAALGLLARLRGSCFVYKVEDLYPDVAIALDFFGPRSLPAEFFGWLSRVTLRRANAVVALDGAMKKTLVQRGAHQVVVIPNWADGKSIRPDSESGRRFRALHDLRDRFVVLYSGNMGQAHRFDAVIAVARQIENVRPEVLFLFVGGGPRLKETQAAAEGLTNVRFLPYQAREELGDVFNSADIHLVTLRPEVSGLLVPSKYASALAAGKPVLLVGGHGSDLHAEISYEGIGWVCSHETQEIAGVLQEAVSDLESTKKRGLRGRRLFERKYDRRRTAGSWLRLVRSLGASPARREQAT